MEYKTGCYFCNGEHVVSNDGDIECWLERDINCNPYLVTTTKLYIQSDYYYKPVRTYSHKAQNKLTIRYCPQCGRDLTKG